MTAVYPVEDLTNLSDREGNILPDVFLIPPNALIKEMAAHIHTDLAKTLLHAVDARTGLRLPSNYKIIKKVRWYRNWLSGSFY